jgi:hypothetical protein
MEVICLRLVAAPLWAGFQFYAISMVFPSSLAYDPGFQGQNGGLNPSYFAPFHRASTGICGFSASLPNLFRPAAHKAPKFAE